MISARLHPNDGGAGCEFVKDNLSLRNVRTECDMAHQQVEQIDHASMRPIDFRQPRIEVVILGKNVD